MNNYREKFESILEDHGIYGEDVEQILSAVHDMLVFVADEIQKEEPYATKTIEKYNSAAYEVFSLGYFLD